MRTLSKIIFALAVVISCDCFALVDSEATAETVALYQRLVDTSGNKILFGQCGFYRNSLPQYGTPCFELTGKYPVVLNVDYDASTFSDRYSLNPSNPYSGYENQGLIYTQLAKQQYQRGGIIQLSWHMYNWVTGGNSKDLTGEPALNILSEGSARATYLTALDRFAEWANSFTDENGNLIPVILRLFHEQDGTWFWWGSSTCSDSQFVEIWRDTVEYLRDTKGVHNVLYCICPEAYYSDAYTGARYPGDAYVDIIGIDVYSDSDDLTATQWTPNSSIRVSPIDKWRRCAQAGIDKGKPFAICEGIRDQVDALREDYWTWLFDQFLADDLIRRMSYISIWELTHWGPVVGRADADNFALLADYPQLGWLEPQKARIKNAVVKR